MLPRLSSRPARWLPAVAVAFATLLAVAALFHRGSWSDWQRPQWLEGDPLEVYLRVRLAAEQPTHALLRFDRPDRLGAPLAGDWSAYPVPDRLVFVLTGWLSRSVGLIAAVQLVAAVILALNAVSFHACARWLRWRSEWAFVGALAFALSSYAIRWSVTLSFSQVFTLPPFVLLCAHASRRARASHERTWSWLAGALGTWLGIGNPYLAYFAGVVAGGALLLALLRRVGAPRLRPLLVFLAVLTAVFLLANVRYFAPRLAGATDAALVRSAGDFVVYALHPLEWVAPPPDHPWAALARIGRAYAGARHGAGELFYNYVGVLGALGLLVIAARAVRRGSPRHGPRADAAFGLLWVIVFAMPGGINFWLGHAGLDVFRAGTRIGVWGLVWALLAATGQFQRWSQRLPRALSVAVALLVGAIACGEQALLFGRPGDTVENAARWRATSTLTDQLENILPPRAMIFQLPVVPFPEAGVTGRMPDYEHTLPILTSHTLRFSYGALRPAPALAWARHVSRLPAGDFIAALERAGFAAIWLNPRAYDDDGRALAESLLAAGAREFPTRGPSGVRVFLLQPAAAPESPDLSDPRLHAPWDASAAAGNPSRFAVRGWFPVERQADRVWRWATRAATLGLWWNGAPTQATLRFRLAGPKENRVALRANDAALPALPVDGKEHAVPLELRAGWNVIEFHLDGRPFRPGGGDPRELGFMVENPAVSVP